MSSIESTSVNQLSKKGLNPIIKAMNDYRNNVIGEHIGSKAPKKTAPIFKVTLEAARLELGIEEGVKNTITIVDKASELFTTNPEKFLKLAEKVEAESRNKDISKPKKSKKKKEEKSDSTDETLEADKKENETKKNRKSSKKDVEEDNVKLTKSTKKSAKEVDNNFEEDVKQVKKTSPKKVIHKKISSNQLVDTDSD